MNKENPFQFVAFNTKQQLCTIRGHRQAMEITDTQAAEMLSDSIQRWGTNRIAALLIWGSAQDTAQQLAVLEFWYKNGYAAPLMRLYQYWQNHFDSESLCSYCQRILCCLPFHAFWVKCWEQWLKCGNPVSRMLRVLKAEYHFDWKLFADTHYILSDSKLSKKMNALVFCVCGADYPLDDCLIFSALEYMELYESHRLFRNLMRNFPLITREGVLLNDHDLYTQILKGSAQKLTSLFPHDKYAGLLQNILEAHEIPDSEQSAFWEYRFLPAVPSAYRTGCFIFKLLPEKETFVVQNVQYLIVDWYQNKQIALYRKKAGAKPELDVLLKGTDRDEELLKRISVLYAAEKGIIRKEESK